MPQQFEIRFLFDGSWDDGTKTVYDGDNAYADFDLSNNLEYSYLNTPAIGPPLEPTLAPELTLIVLP